MQFNKQIRVAGEVRCIQTLRACVLNQALFPTTS